MIAAKIYKGIEFILIGDLPTIEQSAIREWLTLETIIKIHTEKELLRDCVQYKDYKLWFETVFISEEQEVKAASKKINPIKPFGFALDN